MAGFFNLLNGQLNWPPREIASLAAMRSGVPPPPWLHKLKGGTLRVSPFLMESRGENLDGFARADEALAEEHGI
jgi:hypothetical protein